MRLSAFDRPADVLLHALRVHWPYPAYQADPDQIGRWDSRCPICHEWLLTVTETWHGGSATGINCGSGCHRDRILEALEAGPPSADRLTVEMSRLANAAVAEIGQLRAQVADIAAENLSLRAELETGWAA